MDEKDLKAKGFELIATMNRCQQELAKINQELIALQQAKQGKEEDDKKAKKPS